MAMNEFKKSFVQCIPENAVVAIVRFDGYEFHKLVSGSIRCFSSDGVEQKTLTVIRQLTPPTQDFRRTSCVELGTISFITDLYCPT